MNFISERIKSKGQFHDLQSIKTRNRCLLLFCAMEELLPRRMQNKKQNEYAFLMFAGLIDLVYCLSKKDQNNIFNVKRMTTMTPV